MKKISGINMKESVPNHVLISNKKRIPLCAYLIIIIPKQSWELTM